MTTTTKPTDYPVMPRALRVDVDRMLRDMFAAAGDPPALLPDPTPREDTPDA